MVYSRRTLRDWIHSGPSGLFELMLTKKYCLLRSVAAVECNWQRRGRIYKTELHCVVL